MYMYIQALKLHMSGILGSIEWISSGWRTEDMFNRGSARTSSLSNTIILDIQRAPISFKRTSETLRICLISAKGHYMSISSGLSKNTARRLRMDFFILLIHISSFILRLRGLDYNNRLVQTIWLIGSHLSSSWRHNLPASAWHNHYQQM